MPIPALPSTRVALETPEKVQCPGPREIRPPDLIQPRTFRRAQTPIDAKPSVVLFASGIEGVVGTPI